MSTPTATAGRAGKAAAAYSASVATLERRFIAFLESGTVPEGLFADDVFLDLTLPQWRLQATGPDELLTVRRGGHPSSGKVPRWRTDVFEDGFVIEFEETWQADGQQWYCREMGRADVADGVITALSLYCTGDWDAGQQARHRREVPLVRP